MVVKKKKRKGNKRIENRGTMTRLESTFSFSCYYNHVTLSFQFASCRIFSTMGVTLRPILLFLSGFTDNYAHFPETPTGPEMQSVVQVNICANLFKLEMVHIWCQDSRTSFMITALDPIELNVHIA